MLAGLFLNSVVQYLYMEMNETRIALRPVTDHNRAQVLALRVAKEQERHIETVDECLAEAAECKAWRPMGIYAGDTLVGFAMYGRFANFTEKGQAARVWLDRLLIDSRYQGRGYGRAALAALLLRLGEEYGCDAVYLSVYADNARAIGLYRRFGFAFTGEIDLKGEKVMRAEIAP